MLQAWVRNAGRGAHAIGCLIVRQPPPLAPLTPLFFFPPLRPSIPPLTRRLHIMPDFDITCDITQKYSWTFKISHLGFLPAIFRNRCFLWLLPNLHTEAKIIKLLSFVFSLNIVFGYHVYLSSRVMSVPLTGHYAAPCMHNVQIWFFFCCFAIACKGFDAWLPLQDSAQLQTCPAFA